MGRPKEIAMDWGGVRLLRKETGKASDIAKATCKATENTTARRNLAEPSRGRRCEP